MFDMTFNELSSRAIELRRKYAALEISTIGREWSREELIAGFVGDVGALSKLSMAKASVRCIEDSDKKFEHELADCLWSVIAIANAYNINLEDVYIRTVNELDTCVENKLNLINSKTVNR